MVHVREPIAFAGAVARAGPLAHSRRNSFALFDTIDNQWKMFTARTNELIQ
jgi:hypothetical protein